MKIEIFSDVICPWCYIGKQRLDQVLASHSDINAELRWRPYLLYPNLPKEGMDRRTLLSRRYGEGADLGRVPERIREEAEAEGLALRYDLIERTPNTLLAHRLLEFAYEVGGGALQHELAERLFQAYFCEGVDVGRIDALVTVGVAVDLDPAEVRTYLEGDGGMGMVTEQLERAPELGISGVPGYFLADGFLLPGAQSEETMGQIILRVQERMAARG